MLAMKTRSRVMPSSSSISLSSSLPERPDERQTLPVLLGARALADEHEVGMRIAHAEHDLGAAGVGQLAPFTRGRLLGDQLEGRGHGRSG